MAVDEVMKATTEVQAMRTSPMPGRMNHEVVSGRTTKL